LFLKKIKFEDIVEKYKSKYFFKPYIIIDNVKKIKNIDNKIYSSNKDDDIYFSTDRNGNKQVVATSNCKNFKVFKEKGELLQNGRCEYCLQDYNTGTIGYPIKYEEKEYLDSNDKINILYAFWIEGSFCSFECCLKYIQIYKNNHTNSCEFIYNSGSEELLRLLFKLTYPDKDKLLPAQDKRLLKSNGGSLEYNEWKNNVNPFKKTNRLVLIPIKEEFIKQSVYDFKQLLC